MHIRPKSLIPLFSSLVMLASLITLIVNIVRFSMREVNIFYFAWFFCFGGWVSRIGLVPAITAMLIPAIAASLFIVLAFVFAKKNLRVFIIPLAMSVMSMILARALSGPWFMNIPQELGTYALPVTMLVLLSLTVTGKIKSNTPLAIISVLVLGLSILSFTSFANIQITRNRHVFEWVFRSHALDFIPSILFHLAYVILALGITRKPESVPSTTVHQVSPAGYAAAGYPPYNASPAGGGGATQAPEIAAYHGNSYLSHPQGVAAAPAYGAPTQGAATLSAAAQIRELFDLKEQGIISEDEFQRKKQDLLGIT